MMGAPPSTALLALSAAASPVRFTKKETKKFACRLSRHRLLLRVGRVVDSRSVVDLRAPEPAVCGVGNYTVHDHDNSDKPASVIHLQSFSLSGSRMSIESRAQVRNF